MNKGVVKFKVKDRDESFNAEIEPESSNDIRIIENENQSQEKMNKERFEGYNDKSNLEVELQINENKVEDKNIYNGGGRNVVNNKYMNKGVEIFKLRDKEESLNSEVEPESVKDLRIQEVDNQSQEKMNKKGVTGKIDLEQNKRKNQFLEKGSENEIKESAKYRDQSQEEDLEIINQTKQTVQILEPANQLIQFMYRRQLIWFLFWCLIFALFIAFFFSKQLLKSDKIPSTRNYALPDEQDTDYWDMRNIAQSVIQVNLPPAVPSLSRVLSNENQEFIQKNEFLEFEQFKEEQDFSQKRNLQVQNQQSVQNINWKTIITFDCYQCTEGSPGYLVSKKGKDMLQSFLTALKNLPSFSRFCLKSNGVNCDTGFPFIQSALSFFQSIDAQYTTDPNPSQYYFPGLQQAKGVPAQWAQLSLFFDPEGKYQLKLIINYAGPITGPTGKVYQNMMDAPQEQEQLFYQHLQEIQGLINNFIPSVTLAGTQIKQLSLSLLKMINLNPPANLERAFAVPRYQTILSLECNRCDSSKNNLISADGFKILKQMLDGIKVLQGYTSFCKRFSNADGACDHVSPFFIQSPLFLFDFFGKDATVQSDVVQVFGLLDQGLQNFVRPLFGKDVNFQVPFSKSIKLVLNFAGPLSGFSSVDLQAEIQEKQFGDFVLEIQDLLEKRVDYSGLAGVRFTHYSGVFGDLQSKLLVEGEKLLERSVTVDRWSTIIMLDCKNCEGEGNFISVEGLQYLNLVTEKLKKLRQFKDFCLRKSIQDRGCLVDNSSTFILSPLTTVFSQSIQQKQGVEFVTDQDIQVSMQQAKNVPTTWSVVENLFGRDLVTSSQKSSKLVRIILNFAGPLRRYSNLEDSFSEQEQNFYMLGKQIDLALEEAQKEDEYFGKKVRAYQYSETYSEYVMKEALQTDMLYLIGSVVFSIILGILKLDRSLFLSLQALFTCLLSYAAGQLLSRVVFGVDFWLFPFALSALGNLVLGYCNAFIVFDLFQLHLKKIQEIQGTGLEEVAFSRIFKDSAKKLAAVDLSAFIACIAFSSSKIVPVQSCSIQLAVSLVAQFIFFLFYFVWVLAFYQKHFSKICENKASIKPVQPVSQFSPLLIKILLFFQKTRYFFFAIILAWTIVCTRFATLQRYQQDYVENPFKEGHKLHEVNKLIYFEYNPPAYATVDFFFGVKGLERSQDQQKWNADFTGQVVYDQEMDISKPENQLKLSQFCLNLIADKQINFRGSVTCWILFFQQFLAQNNKTFPLTSKNEFNQQISLFLSFLPSLKQLDFIRYNSDQLRVEYFKVSVQVDAQRFYPYKKVLETRSKAFEFLEKQKKEVLPPNLHSAKATAGFNWPWAKTRQEFRDNFRIVFPVYFVFTTLTATLFSLNAIQGILAGLTSLVNLNSFLAIAYWSGWHCSTYEYIPFIVAFTISSFTPVLYSISYQENHYPDRISRIAFMLTQTASNVLTSNTIAIVAALFLVDSQFYLIYNVVFMTTIISAFNILFSTLTFTVANLTFGPQNNFANLIKKNHTLTPIKIDSNQTPQNTDNQKPEQQK